MAVDTIVSFEFSRSNIEALNFNPYLSKLHEFSESPQLAFSYMHRVVFHINGFALDPRGLSVIDSVKKFFLALHKQWPYFFHFAYPNVDNIAWWFAINFFPVVGREDGVANLLEVTPESYSKAMTEVFMHSNHLAERHNFDITLYMARQSEMTKTVNMWLFGRDF